MTIQASGTRTLLMGGQACVFYGAAQVSKDVDFLVLADEANFKKLHAALAILAANRIAVPEFDPAVLGRGHAVHFRENSSHPQADWIEFWLGETRSPELLVELASRFPAETGRLQASRPLLALAQGARLPELRAALDAEVRAEQDKDRLYWEPLKREMEAFRRAERGA